MSAHDHTACREYQSISRRRFLGASGGLAALAALSGSWFPRVVLGAQPRSGRDVLLSIYLRGGADGLTMCVPFGEDRYYDLRPRLAVPRPGSGSGVDAHDLDGFFGLPPALAPLLEPYRAGHLLVVHATGSPDPSRSHFDAQRFMEIGKPGDISLRTGWLGRHLDTIGPKDVDAVLRAVGIGAGLPVTLQGGPATLPVPDLDKFTITGPSSTRATRLSYLNQMYAGAREPVRTAALDTFETIGLLDRIDFAGYTPANGAVYDTRGFGYSLKTSAALVKAGVGVEALHVDLGGWDTHATQGVFTGQMADLMTTLSNNLLAFYRDVMTDGYNVTAVVVSEFGRRAAENASSGSDHGHGNCLFCLGRGIDGGRVLSYWPGLDDLYEDRDLHVTIDYRDILAEIVDRRLGNPHLAQIFPGYAPVYRGVAL